MNKNNIKIFENPEVMAEQAAAEIKTAVNQAAATGKIFNLAVSGGSTPQLLWKKLGSETFKAAVQWEHLHVYWVDERCVPPDHAESNFGFAHRFWLENTAIPSTNIHRIKGENKPEAEVKRYCGEIMADVPVGANGLPRFDLILLGMGTDGHTASIFPGDTENLNSDAVTVVAAHPETGQQRISLTIKTINNALEIIFMITGKDKAEILAGIINGSTSLNYPAGHISPVNGNLLWYLDQGAASLLENQ